MERQALATLITTTALLPPRCPITTPAGSAMSAAMSSDRPL